MKLRSIHFALFLLICLPLPCAAALFDLSDNLAGQIQRTLGRDTLSIDGYRVDVFQLNSFYSRRDYKPAWHAPSVENRKVLTDFIQSLRSVVEHHGLPPADYPFVQMRKLVDAADPSGQLKLEILISHSFLHLAHALHGDLHDLSLLYPGWSFQRKPIDIPDGLAMAFLDNKTSAFITSLEPPDKAYSQLADILEAYSQIASRGGWRNVEAGPALKPQMTSERIPFIRQRLAAEGYLVSLDFSSEVYDFELQSAVKKFQATHGLTPDGVIGRKVIGAMNIPVTERLKQIRANMERHRSIPFMENKRFAKVNIADASLEIIDKGQVLYSSAVVVGRPDRKTPFINSSIRSLIFNPAWHVPKNIASKDILPKLRKDPHYLEKMGFVINGSLEDPHGEGINWKKLRESDFNFRLRQAPGDLNSLGRLKFDFDNDFAVYMHGTPHLENFDKDERHLSSGCVRLRDPEKVALILLKGNSEDWSAERVESEIQKEKTRWVKVDEPLPVLFVYDTVFKDKDGNTHFRPDIYDFDRVLMAEIDKTLAKSARNN